jgi:hypothetical protein
MHSKPSECLCSRIGSEIERIILTLLLASDYTPLSRAELGREVSGSEQQPVEISGALESLYAAGLINVAGELVLPSLAARRMDELQLLPR